MIRWRETEIGIDGSKQRVLRFESLGPITRKEAANILTQRVAVASGKSITRSRVIFAALADQWKTSVLPMYKYSTQKIRLHVLEKQLLPRFGEMELSEITRQEIQSYVAYLDKCEYAPKTIDYIHDVLSAILRTGTKWGHFAENPAMGIDLPKLRTIRPKFALTTEQASTLLSNLPLMAKTMVGLDILTGLRRCELFALRWKCVDWNDKTLTIAEAVYEGEFGTPKTEAGNRIIPLSDIAVELLSHWKLEAKRTGPEDLIFGTRSGKPISPNNILRRFVFPVCDALTLPRVTWLTLRRTYSSWSHDKGIPSKITAKLMGHTNVDVTLNVYTQVMDDSLRVAAEKVGPELFSIVQSGEKEVA